MKKTISVVIFIVALGTMLFSGYQLYDIYLEYKAGDDLYDDFADQYTNIETVKQGHEDDNLTPEIKLNIDFESLIATNKDVVGWIYSEDTPINYPIVQAEDNSYYLHRMIDGTYNKAGSIFMDYRNNNDFTDLNTIIYGHNMNNKSMFGTFDEYESQEYYKEHPTIQIITPVQTYKVDLIAGIVIFDTSDFYEIPQTREELESLYEEIISKSSFKTDLSLEEGDRLISFSTCTNIDDSERYVLIGKVNDSQRQ